MSDFARSPVTAVLGPTNTGKTHLAIERMCAHSSGMIGFPLRLLAREVYDRLVGIKGAHQVALITGEEKIIPDQARWFCCTAESMPLPTAGRDPALERDFAFVALDEAQLGTDPERGHVFTDRLLRARGREETMILGSDALTPMVRALVPEAEIIGRPRFSTLSYAGARKLSRLPKRSAVVAFSVQDVYAVAEMLRRQRGGAAIVMGALSPGTRNAQVDMFMNGDVDYLVATDAIGMGLNLDVAHVAFASLTKFDGKRLRRLTLPEMAQIAGRAGRHQRDGTFGVLGGEDGAVAFRPEEVEAIEQHRFPRIERLYWRDGEPPMDSLDGLIAALERRPDRPELQAAPEAVDLSVLKHLADEAEVRDRVTGRQQLRRLWDACGLPDFQKLGPEHHARTVRTIWRYLSSGNGQVPGHWFAQSVARLDNVQGDIDILSGRLAAIRTWSYIAHRQNWLEQASEMADRTAAIESRLSDALHAALRQRFVDRRTAVLLRDIGPGAAHLPVDITPDGTVQIDGETIGRLDGLRFVVDPAARGSDRRMLLAAAERRLEKLLRMKVEDIVAAPDADLELLAPTGEAPRITWKGTSVAELGGGTSLLSPELLVDKALLALGQDAQKRVAQRLQSWLKVQYDRHLTPLVKMVEQSGDIATPAPVRAFFAQLADAGGVLARTELDDALSHLDKDQRQWVRRAGITIGVLDIYHHGLLKPGAALWRAALLAARRGKPMLPLPQAGVTLLDLADRQEQMGARVAGFRGIGGNAMLRIDMIERVARGAHESIAKNEAYEVTHPLIVSLGLSDPQFRTLMRNAGFRPVTPPPLSSAPEAEGAATAAEDAPVTPDAAPISSEAGQPVVAAPEETAPEQTTPEQTAPEPEGEVGEATGAEAAEPAAEVSEEAAPAPEAAASGDSAEGAVDAAEAPEPAPTGANWAFRGRRKPVPHSAQNQTQGRQGKQRPHKGPGKKPHREGKGNPKDNLQRSRFSREKADGLPPGGGAFAELAILLKRND